MLGKGAEDVTEHCAPQPSNLVVSFEFPTMRR